jgi:SAM-dependent methyltransferase
MTGFTTMADLIRHALHHNEFQRAVLSGVAHGTQHPWRRVIVRKVALQNAMRTQATWHTEATAVTRNYPTAGAVADELADVPFRNVHVELLSATIEARITKRGKLLVSERNATNVQPLAHDRIRDRPVPEDAPFLEALGVSHDGIVKPTAQRKYRQINEFVRILAATLKDRPGSAGTLQVLDLGCGNAYLTFATVHHLEQNGIRCTVTGVDRDTRVITRNNERAQRLGWQDRLTFTTSPIERYTPTAKPDLVIALHACDTATDDVLAFAVDHDVSYVLASPCCHHDLQQQLQPRTMPTAFRDLARDGILKEQLGDVITDALRASLLRVVGYQVDVFAFVPVEHTPRNNLIRAVRTTGPANGNAETSIRALTSMFNVSPRLATLLQNRLPPGLLANNQPAEPPNETP